jgi:hypothetical protein
VDSSIDCIAESLNAIYDVYADKDFDYDEPVFVREGYLSVLESIVDNVHKMVNISRKRNLFLFMRKFIFLSICVDQINR